MLLTRMGFEVLQNVECKIQRRTYDVLLNPFHTAIYIIVRGAKASNPLLTVLNLIRP